MALRGIILKYFTPHHTNNFRAKLLHNSGIFFVIGIILTGNILIRLLESTSLHILGFASSITINEVVVATNAERTKAGLPQLAYSDRLSDAARRKAANMFEENYWAHNSPSGKTPWTWFKSAGYNYLFAGENLAKDFGDTNRMIEAWMASPTHRDNITNSKYSEIGLAVVPGTILGKETVLVVQLFGKPSTGTVSSPDIQANKEIVDPAIPTVQAIDTETAPVVEPLLASNIVSEVSSKPIFNDFTVKKVMSLVTTFLFLLVLVIDLIIAESSVLSRRVGKNWAHIMFLNVVLLATTIINVGSIL